MGCSLSTDVKAPTPVQDHSPGTYASMFCDYFQHNQQEEAEAALTDKVKELLSSRKTVLEQAWHHLHRIQNGNDYAKKALPIVNKVMAESQNNE